MLGLYICLCAFSDFFGAYAFHILDKAPCHHLVALPAGVDFAVLKLGWNSHSVLNFARMQLEVLVVPQC